MSEFEITILERLTRLEAEIAQLRQEKSSAAHAAHEFEQLPDWATVDKEYVAYRFGCTVRAVMRGEAGTDRIKREGSKPLKFLKRNVDAAWRAHTRPAAEIAAEAIAKARMRPKRSIVSKTSKPEPEAVEIKR